MLTAEAPRYSTGVRWVLYLVSALVSAPVSGLIIWLVLAMQPDAESKALGRRCGIISLAVFVASIVLAALVAAAIAAISVIAGTGAS
jgi:hypothetical protein